MTAGRPLKFKTPEELQAKIDAFFTDLESKTYTDKFGVVHQEPVTITGLALALQTSREVLMNYQGRDEFTDTITTAKLRVAHYAEKRMFSGNPTGPIFALKQYGFKDKTEQEITGKDGGPIKYQSISENDKTIIDQYIKELK